MALQKSLGKFSPFLTLMSIALFITRISVNVKTAAPAAVFMNVPGSIHDFPWEATESEEFPPSSPLKQSKKCKTIKYDTYGGNHKKLKTAFNSVFYNRMRMNLTFFGVVARRGGTFSY